MKVSLTSSEVTLPMLFDTVSIIRYSDMMTTMKNIEPHTTMYFFIFLCKL